jgi:hypothetical protein
VDDFLEFAGFVLVIGFLWFVWPPLVLLGAGLLLVMRANTRTRKGRFGAALGSAFAAGRRALKADADELAVRRVA